MTDVKNMTAADLYRRARMAELEQIAAEAVRQVHRVEVREADDQCRRARECGYYDRAGYWSAVARRVREGSRLLDAQKAEHAARSGPQTVRTVFGMVCCDPDLSYWRV